jgi:methylenetetrahydrofolate dehydrogenase (NADP+)/methenyltetrahydrofolate cyclohydrolase
VAQAVLDDVARRVAALRDRRVTPSLATNLVGDDDASAGYIRIKQRQAAELGFDSPHRHLPTDAPRTTCST